VYQVNRRLNLGFKLMQDENGEIISKAADAFQKKI
jgi:hypothetical protein